MKNEKTEMKVSDRSFTVYAERDYFRDLSKILDRCRSDLDNLFSRHKGYLDCHNPEYNFLVHQHTELERLSHSASIRFRQSVDFIKSSGRRQTA